MPLTLRRSLFYCGASALLVCFAFPSFLEKNLFPPTAFLAWIALVPLFRALQGAERKRAVFLIWFFGLIQFGGILYWIGLLEAAGPLSLLAWAALVVYQSLYPLLFGILYVLLVRRFSNGVWVAPILWVAVEYLRDSVIWLGFSWGELGYSQAPYPTLLVSTSVAGVYGLTFLMVWFNFYLAQVWAAKSSGLPGRSWRPLLLPLGVLAALGLGGQWVIHRTPLEKTGSAVLLQPGIDESAKWSKAYESQTYDRLARLSVEASRLKPDLIIWPETAAPSYLLSDPNSLRRVLSIIRSSKCSHLVGCLDETVDLQGKAHDFNAAIHFDPAGQPLGAYHKRHLVPFGEFVPLQKYLSFLGPVVGNLGSFERGKEYQDFPVKGFSYTPMICYEAIFPGEVRKAFATGAEVLVNISNDAWYGRTASAYQHAMMAVVRAAEERKPLLRAANTGISLATDPFGRVLAHTGLYETGILPVDVVRVKSGGRTLYAIWGNWLPWGCWGVIGLLLILSLFHRKSALDSMGAKNES